jgi:hypothetical protein
LNAQPLELARALMGQASSAMAPLQPIFDIVGAIQAVMDCITAVPEMIANPAALVDAIQTLIEKVDRLASLVPVLSVPLMALDLIDCLLAYLSGLSSLLSGMAAQEARIANAEAVAESEDLDVLRQSAACAREQLDAYFAGVKASGGPVDAIIALLNSFLSVVPGAPEIPGMGDLGESVQEAADSVAALVAVLEGIRRLIPV